MDKISIWNVIRSAAVNGALAFIKKSGGIWTWLASLAVDLVLKPIYNLVYRKGQKAKDKIEGKEQAKNVHEAKTPDEVRRAVDDLD